MKATPPSVEPIVHLWILRLIVPMDRISTLSLFGSPSLLQYLKIPRGERLGLQNDPVHKRLVKQYQAAEKAAETCVIPPVLQRNVEKLSALMGLAPIESRLLEFVALLDSCPILRMAIRALDEMTPRQMNTVLAGILGVSETSLAWALSHQSVLMRSGLIRNKNLSAIEDYIEDWLTLPSPEFVVQLCEMDSDPSDFLKNWIQPCRPPTLKAEDYAHIQPAFDLLKAYLQTAISTQRKGVNILLHGKPGTGKTELTGLLAQLLGCQLSQTCNEENGRSLDVGGRLRNLRITQMLLKNPNSLLLMDEVEKLLSDNGEEKAWVNQMLEENPIPTFWVTNHVYLLDNALIRRFDMVVEVPIPSRQQRIKLLNQSCEGLLSQPSIERFAESEDLSPALISRTASVVKSVGEASGVAAEAAFELLFKNTLQAQGFNGPPKSNSAGGLPASYDPAFIHADADLELICKGLQTAKSGRLCLYGPPGTGKTAYVHWLSKKLDRPLISKRASDLMSPYVGENERKIAEAFQEAEQSNSILLMDEIDSFLQDRNQAGANWEITLVNEMLTQMEAFSGIFVASTNRMDGLDSAALRRFDLKAKFDFLKPAQAKALLLRQCEVMGVALGEEEDALSRISAFHNLTPGDFAAVLRQHRFRPVQSVAQLVDALRSECTLKKAGSGLGMGFLSHVAH